MPDFGPEILVDVIAAIGANGGEIGAALTRALDAPLSVSTPESANWTLQSSPPAWNGPGLAISLPIGSSGAAVVIPSEGNLLPAWCAKPDPTGESKLATLAQELGMLLLPEAFFPDDFQALYLTDLQQGVLRGEPAEGAPLVKLPITGSGKQGVLWLIWPVAQAKKVLAVPASAAATASSPAASKTPAQETAQEFDDRLERLPAYAKSLLKIKVPVVVTLASKRTPVEAILQLGLGSILQFDKPCDDTLDLEVADSPVAVGEAVKVGDKFGLRVTGVVLPDERFKTVGKA